MTIPSILAAFLMASAADGAEPAKPSAPTSLWTDWKGLNGASLKAEASPERRRQLQEEAAARGKLVGELAAAGNCAEGERIAREARDFELVRALVAYCTSARR
jgi:hypothetical protein